MHLALEQAIDAHAEAAFQVLERLVAAPSVVGSEQAALDIFFNEANRSGLSAERLPFPNDPVLDTRAGVSPDPARLTQDRYQVLATTPGRGPLHLLLNGHMDVVPAREPDLWTAAPFEPRRREGRLYGRGAADMKCGFAVGLLALRALRDVTPSLFAERRLGFLAVVEEECTGNGTLRSIIEHGVVASEVVVLEPTDLTLLTGGVGILWIDLDVVASSGHAHTSGGQANAIDLGLRLVDGLRRWIAGVAKTEPEPSMAGEAGHYALNLGTVQAGDWISSAPARATFGVRIAFPRAWSVDDAEARVRQVVADRAASVPGLARQPGVRLSGFRARGYLLEKSSALVRDLSAAHLEAHGIQPQIVTLGSTTDARTYLNDFEIPAICFGATGHDLHGIDESVELQSIVDAARTLAQFLLMRFAAEGPG